MTTRRATDSMTTRGTESMTRRTTSARRAASALDVREYRRLRYERTAAGLRARYDRGRPLLRLR